MSASARLIEVRELCAMLNDRARTLGPALLPNGVIEGDHLKTFNVEDRPRRKGSGRSLVLNISGPRRGHWVDYGGAAPGEDKGDMLDLVRIVKCGGDQKRAIEWAKIETGFSSGDQRQHERRQIAREAAARDADAQAEADTQRKRDKAKSLFLRAMPLTQDAAFPVIDYLRHRGLDLHRLGRAPGALRYLPECWNREAGGPLPAMIASVHALDGEMMGVHRTYLAKANGKWIKHPRLVDAKRTFGPSLGGHIPLWKGAGQRGPLHQVAAGTAIHVSEGIEDGLSIAMAMPEARVVCAVSLSKLGALALPPQAGPLVVIMQNDGAGAKAVDALEKAIAVHQLAGRRVQYLRPPVPHKDFNDWLQADAAAMMASFAAARSAAA